MLPDPTADTPIRRGPDPISCAGLLLLVFLLAAGVRAMLSGSTATRLAAIPPNNLPTPVTWPTATPAPTALPVGVTPLPPPFTPTPIPTSPPPTWTPIPTQPAPSPTWTPLTTPPDNAELALWLTRQPSSSPTPSPTPWPQPTPGGFRYAQRVPILMYHYLSTPPEDADIYRTDLSVSPGSFRAQLDYLVRNGYTSIDLYDLTLGILDHKALPSKPIILTFDDGYVDAYLNAFPILREYGFTATFFIITEFVDQGRPGYMTWPMIEEMAAAGMRMEPHTKTHLNLDQQERAFVVYQILGSQETLAAHLGYTPRYFAYPGGRYDDQVIEVLRELDFWGAVTTSGGKWHDFDGRYEWTRLRVRYTTALPEFVDLVQ